MMTDGEMLYAKVLVKKRFYPKDVQEIEGDTFCIFSCEVLEVIEGEAYANNITVKGKPYSLDLGSIYRLKGSYQNHPQYGEAYTILQFVKEYDFTSHRLQRMFLCTLTTERIANLICDTYDDPISILKEGNHAALTRVKGVSKRIATSMIAKYAEQIGSAKAYVVLYEYGLKTSQIASLIRRYHWDSDKLVADFEQDPYLMIEEGSGIGWATADKIAMKKGVAKESRTRIKARILYELDELAQQGTTWITPQLLLENTLSSLSLDTKAIDDFRECLYKLRDSKRIWCSEDKSKISLMSLHELEENIANELYRLDRGFSFRPSFGKGYEDRIADLEAEQGWEYTKEQKDAIRRTIESNVAIITGSAGVGKSSVVRGVLRGLQRASFAQCALSGRAAARLSEVTGAPGSTIHRLLGWNGKSFSFNEENPLRQDIIILDEVSMVGADIFLSLLKAIPTGGKLIMLGDPGQLESIGLCNVFKDMIDSGVIQVSSLTKIHRQAARSAIVTESQKIRKEEALIEYGYVGTEIRGELQDLKLNIYGDSILSQDTVIEEFDKLLEDGVDPKDIQVVVPMRTRGEISVRTLNNIIQRKVNPPSPKLREIAIRNKEGDYILRMGDRVMVTQNIYKAKRYDRYDGVGEECSVFNGDFGYITEVEDGYIVVEFQQYGEVLFYSLYYPLLEHAYAMTCHKLQGSEAPYIIVGIDSSAYMLLTREWLYTAITRAKKYCIICGESKAISQACATSNVSVKKTMLKEMLCKKYID